MHFEFVKLSEEHTSVRPGGRYITHTCFAEVSGVTVGACTGKVNTVVLRARASVHAGIVRLAIHLCTTDCLYVCRTSGTETDRYVKE